MKTLEYLKLLKIGTLPISDRQREKLRVSEKRVALTGAYSFILLLILGSLVGLPESLLIYYVPLTVLVYPVLSLAGRQLLAVLILFSAAIVTLAVLKDYVPLHASKGIAIGIAVVVLLSTFTLRRLQFVRTCGPKLRNWPS